MRIRHAVTIVALLACLLVAGRAAAADTPPGVAEGLLRFAPAGAWGVLSFDASAILLSPALKGVQLQASPDSSVQDFYSISAGAVFLLPGKQPLTGVPPWCAVLTLKAGARAAIEAQLQAIKQREDVEGLRAYVNASVALVFADDNTLLFARDTQALAAIIRAWRAGAQGALDQPLRDALAPVRGDVAFAAVALPGTLADLLGPEGAKGAAPFLLTASGAGAGLTLGDKASLRATVRLGSAKDAKKANTMVQGLLAIVRLQLHGALRQANERARPFIEAMLLIYDNIESSADGADLHLALALNQADVPKAIQAVVATIRARAAAQAAPGARQAEAGPSAGAPAEAAPPDQKTRSKGNLHDIGLTIIMYRAAHDNQFPPDLETLLTVGLFKENEVGAFVDPGDKQPVRAGTRGSTTATSTPAPCPPARRPT